MLSKNDLTLVTNPSKLEKKSGLYFVFSKMDKDLEKPLYIGSATGKSGLYGRIYQQHLNENYTETRYSKDSKADKFQISCNVLNKNNKPIIDKSTLRKIIGRTMKIAPAKDTADYIKENLDFYIYIPEQSQVFHDQAINLISAIIPNIKKQDKANKSVVNEMIKGTILAIESLLITKYKPIYNTQKVASK